MHTVEGYYHVYSRGCSRQTIFANAENYLFLLRRAKVYLDDGALTMIAYCLMPNHDHFLLRQNEGAALSRFVQRLFNSYTQAFNKQQGRSRTLFEGRARSVVIETDEYVVHLRRYIHLNPVKGGLVEHPGDWPYSNYLEWVEEREGSLVDSSFARQFFPAAAEYRAFVLGDVEQSMEQELQAFCLE